MSSSRPLPIEQWPPHDREIWDRARNPRTGVLSKPKACAKWGERHWQGLEEANALWLGWLSASDILDPSCSPAARCTPDRLRSFIEDLLAQGSPGNAVHHVRHLQSIFSAFDPDGARQHLTDAHRYLRHQMRKRRGMDLPPISGFLQLARELREQALKKDGRHTDNFARLRDSLAITLLCHRALRRFNFANLKIGSDLYKINGTWMIFVSPGQTKAHKSRPMPFPEDLVLQLEEYLAARAKLLEGSEPTASLWISIRHRPITPASLADALGRRSMAKFNKRYGAHFYRHLVASHATSAEKAAILLGNTPEVAGSAYRQSSKAQALRRFHEMLGLTHRAPDGDTV